MAGGIVRGQILEDRYRIDARLGGGNFGTVYRAEELMNGAVVREVALKIYSPEATASGNVEGMFEDCALPAKILASAESLEIKRHFVQIYGWGKLMTEEGECAYVSMELVRGAATLEDLTERYIKTESHPDEAEVLGKMRQFFTALAAAHRAGVLHRDIKGANVMISGGDVKVVDFGMGASMAAERQLKTTVTIFAPENFNGKYSPASDVYQAGLMFYKYWTGVHPFEGSARNPTGDDMLDARQMRIDWRYMRGSEMLGMEPSERIDSILAKCLCFAEGERFASAVEILPSLEERSTMGVIEGAVRSENMDFAEREARQALADPKTVERERVEIHRALGDISVSRGDDAAAVESYIEAYKFAKESGAYFLNKPRGRELIEAICACYERLGKKPLAKLYRKKIDDF